MASSEAPNGVEPCHERRTTGGASSAALREPGHKAHDASMTTNRTRQERRSPRLPGRNYALASGYLVTAMVDDRTHRFGEVIDGVMVQNAAGRLVQSTWLDMAERFSLLPSMRSS